MKKKKNKIFSIKRRNLIFGEEKSNVQNNVQNGENFVGPFPHIYIAYLPHYSMFTSGNQKNY
jgi:hypothetical protein